MARLTGVEPVTFAFGGQPCTQILTQWFYGIHPGWSNDTILIEQAVHIGRYGWLTLLWPESYI